MFSVTSRYFTTETAIWVGADGRQIAYIRRRFLPIAPVVMMTEHVVTQGDRLDNVTAQYMGDPEQFWRVADANNTMHPDELTQPQAIGQRVIIPLIQGG